MKNSYKIVSLYCFISIKKSNLLSFRNKLLKFEKDNLSGLIILAKEGINGTICGSEEVIDDVLKLVKDLVEDSDINEKISFSNSKIFKGLKIKLKSEIVTMGVSDVSPKDIRGKYIDAINWNKLIEDQNTVVIDTRNFYEVSIGSFKNAINPKTKNFREFPKWLENNLETRLLNNKNKNIAMFCTGGIRCEKATSLLRSKGYMNVYHLKGGILKYIEDIPSNENLYQGECYVFDERVSLNNQLKKGSYSICHACGLPLSKEDKNKETYIEGIQCHQCINKFSDWDRQRFAERQKQIDKKKSNEII